MRREVMIGKRLGPYEITAKLGEGGMGEVYRAHDSRLERDAAIKVLPAAFVADPERLARFEREAKLLAQLHHPNVASIFGLEEAGGVRALVMELVEGPTLADKLSAGSLPLEESLAVAKQIAEALEAAHDKGIVHRDLKPQNVKVTADGTVKVLDFGLAKAMEAGGGPSTSGDLTRSPTLMNSPTLTAAGTQLGVILGTAAYMAPEQARGAAVDKRADIWAFGVVFYEMLAGRTLFAGPTVTDTLAGVLKTEIDWKALPAETPPAIRGLLRRCLERNPKNRLHDIADARIAIDELLAGVGDDSVAAPAAAAPRGLAALLPWAIAAAALIAAIAVWISTRTEPATSAGAYELALAAPAGAAFDVGSNSGWGVVSPDGRRVVFPAGVEGHRALWVRSLDRADARPLAGTEAGFYPFWSPDSRWVAFFTDGALMKVEVEGGLPERICAAPQGRGGSWGGSGWIVMTPLGGGAISRVRAEGGEPVPVTALDAAAGEDAHYWPVWLPGEKSFLYFIRSGRRENQGVYLGRVVEGGIDGERRRIVATSSSGLFAPALGARAAALLWAQEDRLLARAFDPASGALSGAVSEVSRGVRVLESQRATMASVSTTGTLVLASSQVGRFGVESFDRKGRSLGALPIARGDLHQLIVSPDGRRFAYVVVREGQGDIWVHDLATGASRALTTSAEYDEVPIWSPDSSEILFRSGGGEEYSAMRARADGETAPRRQAFGPAAKRPVLGIVAVWLSERWGIAGVESGNGGLALGAIGFGDAGAVEKFPGRDGVDNRSIRYSYPLRALSYSSDETGAPEGFVVSVDATPDGVRLGSDRQRVPVEGAQAMRWREDGRELYALSADGALWAVPVERRDGVLHLGAPARLFGGSFLSEEYEVLDNGERFLFRVDPEADRQTLTVVLDWPARLGEKRP